jgi:FkbM family methyltransferase
MTNGHVDFAALYPQVASFYDAGEEFERVIRRVYERVLQPGDTAVDVGAHSGKHTLPLALSVAPAGCVVAIEPIRKAFDVLEQRVRNAGLDGVVTVVHGCVSSAPGTATFSVIPDHLGWSSLAPRHGVVNIVEVQVAQHTLDLLCANNSTIRFVKIDVEGAEPDVIKGASMILSRDRPIVHVEVVPAALSAFGRSTADVADPLREHGYRIFDLLGNDVTDASAWYASSIVPHLADYVAVHADDEHLDVVIDELMRSFSDERSDVARRPPGLESPPLRSRMSSATRSPSPESLPAFPQGLARLSDVQPVVWPAPGFQRLLIGAQEWLVLNSAGDLARYEGAATIELPIDSYANRLGNGVVLRARIEFVGYSHAGTSSIAEFHWTSTGLITLVRSRRDRRVELLWLRDGQLIASDAIDMEEPATTFDLRLAVMGHRVETTCRLGENTIRTVVPRSMVGIGDFDLAIGRRRHSSNPEPVTALQAVVSFSLTPAERRERLDSELSRLRRAVKRRSRVFSIAGVTQRIRKVMR